MVVRNNGLYPIVFADEYTYSMSTRLHAISLSSIPNYLYLATFRTTNFCSDDYLSCVRILNALFFIGATPFIYLTARRLATPLASAVVTVLAVVSPLNSYTAYFMPEAFYFFGFWVFVWSLLSLGMESSNLRWAIAGALFGLCTLIKPHALFFAPAILAYIAFYSYRTASSPISTFVSKTAALFGAGFFIKFSLSYLIAGNLGLTFFGSYYGSLANSTSSGYERYIYLLINSWQVIRGHLLGIVYIYSLPLAITLFTSWKIFCNRQSFQNSYKDALLTLLILANLIIVVGLFTTSIAGSQPFENNERLHMRYYNFMLPMLWIVAAASVASLKESGGTWCRSIIALLLGAILIYGIFTKLSPYAPVFVDSPELAGLVQNKTIFRWYGFLSLALLIVWVYKQEMGAKIYLFVLAPVAMLVSSIIISKTLLTHLVPDPYDRAGQFTKQHLSKEELQDIVVVGPAPEGLLRTLFHLDNPNVIFILNTEKIPHSKKWVLVIGNVLPPIGTSEQIKMDGFSLSKIGPPLYRLNFSTQNQLEGVKSIKGLSPAETWGAWSNGNEVVMEFSSPLPEKFNLRFMAHAFGTNVGEQFWVQVGSEKKFFTLTSADQEISIPIDNPTNSKLIYIHIPSPVSPKQLGFSEDKRTLGIGLSSMSIENF